MGSFGKTERPHVIPRMRFTRREAVKTLARGGLAVAAITCTDGGCAMVAPTNVNWDEVKRRAESLRQGGE